MKNNYIFLFAACCLALLFSNCASVTGFETGRTVGEGNGSITLSLNASRTPDFDINDDDENDAFFFPNLEASGRYGITEKFDLGLRANTILNLGIDAKYQVLGDDQSQAALAVGGGVATFGLFVGLWNVQVPLYFSLHPTPDIDVYITPRYIFQFSAGDLAGGINYLGGNGGIMYGKRTKFGLDFGLYNLSSTVEDNAYVNFITVGFGVKIPL